MTTNTIGTNGVANVTVEDVQELARILRNHRHWHCREQYSYPLHPLIVEAIGLARPVDWHRLVLEWPHRSTEKHDEIAYTRDEGKGRANVQTRVGAGKYLARHWPHLPSNVLRDLVAAHIVRMEGSCKFLDATTKEIVRSVQEGPCSCMKWDEDELDEGSTDGHHPYEVYAPELGWRAAVRLNPDGRIIGRALVHDGTHMREGRDTAKSVFVRSYKCHDDIPGTREYSHADEKLEAWLEKQGVSKKKSWPWGTPFKHIYIFDHGPLLPYLDGNDTHVTEAHCGVHYRMDDDEEDGYNCDCTDGTGSSVEEGYSNACDRCGERCDEDDLTRLDSEEQSICDCCLERYYTCTTEHGWVRDGDVEWTVCLGYSWDANRNEPDYVRYLDAGKHAGNYAHEDDIIYALDEHFWHVADIGTTDGCIVRLCKDSHHDGEFAPVEDCVQIDGDWFHREADVEHDNIVEITRGWSEGEFVIFGEDVLVGLGDKGSWGVWAERDLWNEATPCTVSSARLQPPKRGTFIVYLHESSEFAGEAVDIVDAVLVPDVGWFMPVDEAAGNIVRIMDDVYALASDLVAA